MISTMYQIVIIDDEQSGVDLLVEIISKFSTNNIKIMGTANNLHKDGIELINKTKPDIVFIDIEMPIMNGLAIYKYFKDPEFKIIFTTAYAKYSIEALKKQAFDYILKPTDFIEIHETLQKAIKEIEKERQKKRKEKILKKNNLFDSPGKDIIFNHSNGFIKVNTNDIEYCSAEQAYSYIYYEDKRIMVTKTLIDLQRMFPKNQFYRTHKSYLINISYIDKFIHSVESFVVLKSGVKIPVSTRKCSVISMEIMNLLNRE